MDKTYSVYVHISPSYKIYVGITSLKPEYRWNYGRGYRKNEHFYRAIQKYGWDNFKHIILASNLTKEEAEKMEIDLIFEYGSTNSKYGYNIEKGGNSTGKLSDETKRKISAKESGENNPFYGKHHTDKTKRIIGDKAKERYKNGQTHPMLGRKHTEESKELMSIKTKERLSDKKNHPMYGRTGAKNPKSMMVAQINKDTDEVMCIWDSIGEASRALNINKGAISYCCNGHTKTSGGFKWEFYNNIKR